MSWTELLPALRAGDPLALSRLISRVENQGSEKVQIMKTVFAWTGKAYIVGLTGPPGAGKSTITNGLVELLAEKGLKVGVVCVDPSSPFSGGAFLGDRIRMTSLDAKPGVFIRSLASRGSLGGLSAAAKDVVQLLDAAGKDVVLIETVGMGQVGDEIKKLADTTVLVTVPGLGDGIQTFKAGIMEIADIFIVNKAEREGADETVRDLEMMLSEVEPKKWRPRVLKTCALRKEGLEELWESLQEHRRLLEQSGQWMAQRRNRANTILLENSKEHVLEKFQRELEKDELLLGMRRRVDEGSLDPYTAALFISEYFLANRT
ncbi:MAG: methylmalonyl Co-A mutase-associated GTPase MeaB [Firmicutes bacterium]|nr:methylmalonyl Co-A mutase-associated GTPase MeaB [Bacillota bacterium]